LQSAHIKALLPRVGELCVAPPEIRIWEQIA
jgi:quinol monooxygenase YgiN